MPPRRLMLGALLVLALTGCQRTAVPQVQPFNGVDVTGATYGGSLRLPDTGGQRRTLADFKGQVVLVDFGFTQCPDVCPVTLQNLVRVVRAVKAESPQGRPVQVLFITIDPDRDTPPVLAAYLRHFDPGFLGLTGTPAEIQAVSKDFKTYVEIRRDGQGGTVGVDHSSGVYAFDADGRLRLYFPPDLPVEKVTADVNRLARS